VTPNDTYGDNCTWYEENVAYCGVYDDGDFVAANCPACLNTWAVLQGIKQPHPMVNLNLQKGAFPLSLVGTKKIPLNMQIDEMA